MNLPDEKREAVAGVLAAHVCLYEPRVYPSFECSCGEWDGAQGDDGSETDGQNDNAAAYRAHLADALAPLLAGWLAEARAEALREAADAWTQGQWSEVMLPKPAPPAVPVIAYANRVGDWLRDRAALDADAAETTGGGA